MQHPALIEITPVFRLLRKGGSMKRSILVFLLLLSLSAASVLPALAQVPPPSLALKDAVDIATEALTNAKVDLARYFIYSVTYTNSAKGTYWYFIFKTIKPTTGQEANVKVYMNGSTEFSGAYFLQTGY